MFILAEEELLPEEVVGFSSSILGLGCFIRHSFGVLETTEELHNFGVCNVRKINNIEISTV